MSSIGERIKHLRNIKKITQAELSERVFVTQSYVSRIESDKEKPTEMLIKLLALDFNVSYNWLSTGNGTIEIGETLDYFERNQAEAFRSGVSENLEKLQMRLAANSMPAIDSAIVGILSQIRSLLDMFDDDPNLCAVIFDNLCRTVCSFTDVISRLQMLNTKSPTYLNSTYKQILVGLEDYQQLLTAVGSLYEERIK